MAFIEKTLVPHLFEEPPLAFDIGVVERPVGVGGVDPHAGAGGERTPLLDIATHRFAASSIELGDPVGLDLDLVVEPKLLFDLDLHRKSVTIPAALAGHSLAAHGLKAGEKV